MIGRVIGNYRIDGVLAQGGMGTVYRGKHLNLPRQVVVKSILLSAFSPSVQSLLKARFRREAYIQSQFDHPNIVRVYEFFTLEDNYYLIMEYVPGMSLGSLISRGGVQSYAHAVHLCKQALSALHYAHNFSYVDENDAQYTGVIHRDIKPANLLLGPRGILKITDFGIVKVTGDEGLTQSGFQPGTVEYMSPEQLLGKEIDEKSDIYSLGVTFYELISGRLPFRRSETGSDWDVRKGHIEMEPQNLNDLRPDIEPSLAEIVMKSLRKNPDDRFKTAAEFLNALNAFEKMACGTVRNYGTEPVSPNFNNFDVPATVPITNPINVFSDLDDSTEEAITIPLEPSGRTVEREKRFDVPDTVPIRHEDSEPLHDLTRRKVYISVPATTPTSRRPIALAIIGAIALVVAAGGYLLKGQMSSKIEQTSIATTVQPLAESPTPVPEASPAQVVALKPQVVNASSLREARAFEGREEYAAAIRKYEEYLRQNPMASDTGVVSERLTVLRQFQGLVTAAESAMENRKYLMARQNYTEALKLIPESIIAGDGLKEADGKVTSSRQGQLKRMVRPGQAQQNREIRKRRIPQKVIREIKNQDRRPVIP